MQRNSTKILQLITLILLLSHARTGHITTGDLIADFNNKNYISQIQFPFKLDNSISAEGALVIDSPINLGTTTLIAKW